MRLLLRYLTFAVLLGDFAAAGMLPTLYILARGSRWAGTGRYRGALEASQKLAPFIAWVVRAKVGYALLLLSAQALGWVSLPWPAVVALAALFLGWETGLEATRAFRRLFTERSGSPLPAGESASGRTPPAGSAANRTALWVIVGGGAALFTEVGILLGSLLPGLFVVD
jgi:hypothetical protein